MFANTVAKSFCRDVLPLRILNVEIHGVSRFETETETVN